MGRELNKNKVLATLVIIILLGLLVGMVWLDRQQRSAQEANSDQEINQVNISEEGQDSDEPEKEMETAQTEVDSSGDIKNLYQGLTRKANEEEFTPQKNNVKLRTIGGVQLVEGLSEFANVNADIYKQELARMQELGIDKERSSVNGIDYSLMFDLINDYVAYADVTVAQLGMPVAYPQLPQSEGQILNAPKAILANLQEMGVDVIATANQHALDKGSQGIIATLNNIKDQGMEAVGTSKSIDSANAPLIKEINGLKIAFLSYTSDPDGQLLPVGQEFLMNTTNSIDTEAIKQLADESDAVVVNIQHHYDTSEEDRSALYQTLSDAGVKLILGNNLSDVQPMEWINDKQTLAIHSQSNLLGQSDADATVAGIVEVEFNRESDGTVKIQTPKIMPTVIARTKDSDILKVAPLADSEFYGIDVDKGLWDSIVKELESLHAELEIVTHLESVINEQDIDNFRQ